MFFQISSDFFHSSSEATRSFFIVGESWWVMLVSHVLPPLTPYSLARLKQQYIHNWWKESERYCQNMSELTYPLQLSAFFSSPQLRPHLQQILLRELCPLTVFHHHLLELIRECVQRLLALFFEWAWRSRIVRPDMTGLITRRKDEDHQGLVQHLKRFKGRETKRW